jgi:hypothetical protein
LTQTDVVKERLTLRETSLLSKRLKPLPNIITRREENCFLLVSRKTRKVLVVNELGIRIWDMLQKQSVTTTISSISKEYRTDQSVAEKEVLKFVKKLLESNFAICEDSRPTEKGRPRRIHKDHAC